MLKQPYQLHNSPWWAHLIYCNGLDVISHLGEDGGHWRMVGSNSSQGPSFLPSAAATSTSSGDDSETTKTKDPTLLVLEEKLSLGMQNTVHKSNLPNRVKSSLPDRSCCHSFDLTRKVCSVSGHPGVLSTACTAPTDKSSDHVTAVFLLANSLKLARFSILSNQGWKL